MTTADDIDAMLAERKGLEGRSTWVRDDRGSVAHLKATVAGGSGVESVAFVATALVHEPVQTGSCVLVVQGRPLQRLSFRPTHAHVNPPGPKVPPTLRGLRLPAGHSRIYRWENNRSWPRLRSDNVTVGQPLLPDVGTLELALAIFLHICNIEGEIPSPP